MLRRLHHEQPESFAFTPENQSWAEAQITKYPEGRQASAVIPLLWRAQEQEGWLSRPAIEHVAGMLGMDFILAIAENHVPSTHEPDPYMHVFLDAGNENVLAFFELPTKPEMGRDPNTPVWVQHIAFKVTH